MLEYIVIVVASTLLAIMAKGSVHCGRVVVSGAWQFCPFCGDRIESKKKALAVKSPITQRKQKAVVKRKKQKITKPLASATRASKRDLRKNQTQFIPSRVSASEFGGGVMDAYFEPCPHVASRGKPKGKSCRMIISHEGRHSY